MLNDVECGIYGLLTVMESSRTCTWPRGSLRTHFQVLGLGLGLGLVKFSMTHRCNDTATKEVLMVLAKTVISVSSFPS